MRLLIVAPILHDESDMGTLSVSVREQFIEKNSLQEWDNYQEKIRLWWSVIDARLEELLQALALPFEKIRIYQDGLIDGGNLEKIIQEVAGKGSKNYRLLQSLMQRGAAVMGTESAELLISEYQFQKNNLHPSQGLGTEDGSLDKTGQALLLERDKNIAARINNTLCEGEVGFLFIGLRHAVESHLSSDIKCRHLIEVPNLKKN